MRILGEKYTKNELVFCIYALASNRCLDAMGIKNIDAIVNQETSAEQKRDYCATLASYLGSMHEAVVRAREQNVVDSVASMYGLMAQTGKKIVDMAAKAKEAANANQCTK